MKKYRITWSDGSITVGISNSQPYDYFNKYLWKDFYDESIYPVVIERL